MPQPRDNFRLIVSVVVLDGHGRLLLVQEAKPELRGRWNLPGGHMDHGELPPAAATRELYEETWVNLPMEGLLECYCTAEAVRFVFVARADRPVARPGDDILAVRWSTVDELLAMPQADLVAPHEFRMIAAALGAGRRHDPAMFVCSYR